MQAAVCSGFRHGESSQTHEGGDHAAGKPNCGCGASGGVYRECGSFEAREAGESGKAQGFSEVAEGLGGPGGAERIGDGEDVDEFLGEGTGDRREIPGSRQAHAGQA